MLLPLRPGDAVLVGGSCGRRLRWLSVEMLIRYKHETQANEFPPLNWRIWMVLTRLRFVLVLGRDGEKSPGNR